MLQLIQPIDKCGTGKPRQSTDVCAHNTCVEPHKNHG